MPSLNKDGGVIPLMAVKIVKMYPLAYMSREKGQKSAPWSEAEEFVQQEQWSVSTGSSVTWIQSLILVSYSNATAKRAIDCETSAMYAIQLAGASIFD
jgi:hypothetical protein